MSWNKTHSAGIPISNTANIFEFSMEVWRIFASGEKCQCFYCKWHFALSNITSIGTIGIHLFWTKVNKLVLNVSYCSVVVLLQLLASLIRKFGFTKMMLLSKGFLFHLRLLKLQKSIKIKNYSTSAQLESIETILRSEFSESFVHLNIFKFDPGPISKNINSFSSSNRRFHKRSNNKAADTESIFAWNSTKKVEKIISSSAQITFPSRWY